MSLVALANVVRRDLFVSRFHADPRIQATELLLQERVPREAILSEPRPAEAEAAPPTLPVFASRSFRTPHTRNVHTHFLSNGRYTIALTNAGGGYSMWRDMAVTRRREDPTSDAGAHYIYLRDPWSKRVWSATHLPIGQEPDQFDAVFELDKATFRRRDDDFETKLEMTVSSEDDVEVRRLTIRNRGRQTRELEVTSYVELVLGRFEDDLAHPAFGKLFIETEVDPQSAGLIFTRRPRAADESPVVGFHVLGVDGQRLRGAVEWETDRARFIGRGRTHANPVALEGSGLSGTTGAVLDPIGSVRERLRLPPGASVRVVFATGVAADRIAALALARKSIGWQRRFARVLDGVHPRPHHPPAPRPQRRAGDAVRPARVTRVRLGQHAHQSGRSGRERLRSAEPVGLRYLRRSADLLVRVLDTGSLPLVRQLLNAQEYWRVKALRADLVILNGIPPITSMRCSSCSRRCCRSCRGRDGSGNPEA